MKMTRREVVVAGAGMAAVSMLPLPAFAEVPMVGTAEEFLGGATAGEGGITLTAPEIAENGNTVPVSVDAPGAVEIQLYAMGNPVPGIASFKFGPMSGSQAASIRIRLAGSQDVVAVAKMADGSYVQAAKAVKVTIGGCGG